MREEFYLLTALSSTTNPNLVCDITALSCKFLRQSETKATCLMALLPGLMSGTKGTLILLMLVPLYPADNIS